VPSALVLDTSGLLAVLDANQRFHAPARKAFDGYDGPLLLSPFVLAELDYLLTARVSQDAQTALLSEVARRVPPGAVLGERRREGRVGDRALPRPWGGFGRRRLALSGVCDPRYVAY
jgi:hypothetical protein